jgi:hypothetical protein
MWRTQPVGHVTTVISVVRVANSLRNRTCSQFDIGASANKAVPKV